MIEQTSDFLIAHPPEFELTGASFRAESWEAWDALPACEGWKLERWLQDQDSTHPVLRYQKVRGKVVVLPPAFDRGTVKCDHCVRGTFVDSNRARRRCSWCNGTGRINSE